MRKYISIFILTIFLAIIFVHAITLTKEATEKVEVPMAIKATVCKTIDNECVDEFKEIVFGTSLVFPKDRNAGLPMNILVIGDNLYRSYQDSSRIDEKRNILIKEGNMSRVLENGFEENTGVSYYAEGAYTNIRQIEKKTEKIEGIAVPEPPFANPAIFASIEYLRINVNNEIYLLHKINKKTNFTWVPEEL